MAKKEEVWCTLKENLDALNQPDNGDSLQKIATIQVLEIEHSKTREKIKRTFISHECRSRTFTAVSQNPQKTKAKGFR
jgi:hypothetical protein